MEAMSGKEELDIFGVTFHNLSVPLWCNDVSLKLIHFKILPCVTLTGHHTTAGACFGSSFGQNLMREVGGLTKEKFTHRYIYKYTYIAPT